MEKERINILIGSDINYAPYYGVMLTSLFMNNTKSQFDVYLLTDNSWTEHETHKFEKLCEDYNSRFFVYIVDVDLVKDFPMAGHITLPTYYRLQACNILPKSIHKILYIDGDMLVLKDIRKLWEIELSEFAFAGVEDMDSINKECFDRLGYEEKYGYYNAGVSLYNFDYWRQNNLSEQLLNLIRTQPEKIKWMDQDAVNLFLHQKRYKLPLRYNFQVYYLNPKWWNAYSEETHKMIKEECSNAIIVHFNGAIKPWTFRYLGFPYAETWKLYNNLSLWHIDINIPRIKYIKQWIKRILCPPLAYKNRNENVIAEYRNYR